MRCWAKLLAWMVGWALILEYAVAAGAVSVGWSGYFVGLLMHTAFGLIARTPPECAAYRARCDGGIVQPAGVA